MQPSVDDVGSLKRGASKLSPTRLTLRHYRNLGYLCEVVEYYNAYSQRRHDFYNFADVAALNEKELLLIQTTTKPNISARRNKMAGIPAAVMLAGIPGIRILVVGWGKKRGRWEPVIQEMQPDATFI